MLNFNFLISILTPLNQMRQKKELFNLIYPKKIQKFDEKDY